ncbi:MAG: sigma-70 family RNA polymerase sigma factor [Actinomycetota bacterium]
MDSAAEELVARARTGDRDAWTTVVERVEAGDRAVWSALVDRYTSLVWSVARGLRLSDADAADVHQTAWLKVAERIDSVREPERFPGWLGTLTRNEGLRLLRRRGREVPDDDPVEVTPAVEPGPEAIVLEDERDGTLWQAFSRLSDRCQELLRLLVLDDELSYDEVAGMLGVSIGSLGPTRARCLDRLRSSPEISRIRSGDR